MKRSIFCALLFVSISAFACCFLMWHHYTKEYDSVVKQYEQQLEEHDTSEEILHIKLAELQAEKVGLEQQVSELLEENTILNNDFKLLMQKIDDFHMEPPETRFYEAISENEYISAEGVTLRKMPCDSEEFYTGNTLAYYKVTPLAVVFESVMDLQDKSWNAEDRHWVLVSCHMFGDWMDSYGWVRFSELVEYNEDTMHLLKGPFMLAEDAVDIETGELVHELLRGSWVSVQFKEDYVRVGTHGGIFGNVDKKYLIYPE